MIVFLLKNNFFRSRNKRHFYKHGSCSPLYLCFFKGKKQRMPLRSGLKGEKSLFCNHLKLEPKKKRLNPRLRESESVKPPCHCF